MMPVCHEAAPSARRSAPSPPAPLAISAAAFPATRSWPTLFPAPYIAMSATTALKTLSDYRTRHSRASQDTFEKGFYILEQKSLAKLGDEGAWRSAATFLTRSGASFYYTTAMISSFIASHSGANAYADARASL